MHADIHTFSFVYYLIAMDLLQEQIDDLPSVGKGEVKSPVQKYVCDCDRGGHLSIYSFYLIRDHGYLKWPRQPWFQDITKQNKKIGVPWEDALFICATNPNLVLRFDSF